MSPSVEAKARFFGAWAPSVVICRFTLQRAAWRVPPYRPGASPFTLRVTVPAAGAAGAASSCTTGSVKGSGPVAPAA
ncbi:hypothetical protein F7R91_34115 [Streptomyces luteolifulvus]|uniref:Uncharacterized protein n=1 Tax=Streptomyces luteolifulvus TaxID=2615112 RepID=A0A6H9UPB7_9ACTN|nr:hypothetical protein F7R91_36795 [Streptomyces luteolifulvus]KAB1141052.1 hypothetical protein F7R91_34115 [Streptomyces luteolifulvus]